MTFVLRNNQSQNITVYKVHSHRLCCWLQLGNCKMFDVFCLFAAYCSAAIAFIFHCFSIYFFHFFYDAFFSSHYLCSWVKPLIKYRASIIFYRMNIAACRIFCMQAKGIFGPLCWSTDRIAIFHLKIITLSIDILCNEWKQQNCLPHYFIDSIYNSIIRHETQTNQFDINS